MTQLLKAHTMITATLCMWVWLTGCSLLFGTHVEDMYNQLPVRELTQYQANIRSIDWIEDQIVLTFNAPRGIDRILEGQIVDPSTGVATEFRHHPDIRLPCEDEWITDRRRLPDGRLGYGLRCEGGVQGIHYRLYAWDVESKQLEFLFIYPAIQTGVNPTGDPLPSEEEYRARTRLNVYTSDFALSPDMTQVLQESQGDGFFNRLLYVNRPSEEVIPMYPDAGRVGSPSWSTDGTKIAFAASQLKISTKGNIFSGLPALRSIMLEPWEIYVAPAPLSEPEAVLSNIVTLDGIRWRPGSTTELAFRGRIGAREGLWTYDLERDRLRFIWPANLSSGSRMWYDWSPDGDQIALVDWRVADGGSGVVDELFPPAEGRILIVDVGAE